jgi:hypothetical protein
VVEICPSLRSRADAHRWRKKFVGIRSVSSALGRSSWPEWEGEQLLTPGDDVPIATPAVDLEETSGHYAGRTTTTIRIPTYRRTDADA